MIGTILNIAANPKLATIAQNTKAAVSIETGMKAVGRPSFILADNNIPPETKKYAATKEFLYQATCLAVYLALVMPIFKNGSFTLAKKQLFKNDAAMKKFDKINDFLKHFEKAKEAKTLTDSDCMMKGAIEAGSILGSILGLAIFAPQGSHVIVHPLMNFHGIKKEEKQG
jgi:hypothetical protein